MSGTLPAPACAMDRAVQNSCAPRGSRMWPCQQGQHAQRREEVDLPALEGLVNQHAPAALSSSRCGREAACLAAARVRASTTGLSLLQPLAIELPASACMLSSQAGKPVRRFIYQFFHWANSVHALMNDVASSGYARRPTRSVYHAPSRIVCREICARLTHQGKDDSGVIVRDRVAESSCFSMMSTSSRHGTPSVPVKLAQLLVLAGTASHALAVLLAEERER